MRAGVAGLALAALALAGPALAEDAPTTAPDATPPPACGTAPEGVEIPERLLVVVAERRAKCAALRPYEGGFVERQLLALEKAERPALAQLNLWGFYPRLQTIDHRSQVAAGVRLWRPRFRDSPVDVHGAAFVSRQGFQFLELQAGVLAHRGDEFPGDRLRCAEAQLQVGPELVGQRRRRQELQPSERDGRPA